MTWSEILARMTTAPPKKHTYSTSYDVFQVDNRPKKKVQKSTPKPDYVGWTCEKLWEKLQERGENFFGQKAVLVERWKRKRERKNKVNTFYSLPSPSMIL